jgi:hypothetical protein
METIIFKNNIGTVVKQYKKEHREKKKTLKMAKA